MILGIIALIVVICYFGGWGIQTFIKYTTFVIAFCVMGVGYILKYSLRLLIKK
ncbi:hypothetical protein SAMN05216438_11316 [Lactococcus garvieae]|uniref:Uncharacterized protein n=1 Tax=Lactococcus garvieae TaxID=1363 RepID=A0A1I4I5C5_9LACT|nr:hypothetical protein SAMN05216438_11316 [Lactococcus garvieae]